MRFKPALFLMLIALLAAALPAPGADFTIVLQPGGIVLATIDTDAQAAMTWAMGRENARLRAAAKPGENPALYTLET